MNQPDTSALRAALDAVVDAYAAATNGEQPHLARVRAAKQARAAAADVAEQVLDDAILAARRAGPSGATWAELGEVLDVSGQAVSKRAGVREIPRQRRHPTRYEREQRRRDRMYERLTGHPAAPVREKRQQQPTAATTVENSADAQARSRARRDAENALRKRKKKRRQ